MTLEGDTLIQIQKWWDSIFSYFCQSLSTNKSWREEHHNISNILLSSDTHRNSFTAKENYESFLRALIFHIVEDNTISSSKAPKLHVDCITYMNNDNGFDLLIFVVFSMIPQIGVIGPKPQYLVISFCRG